MPRHDLLVPPAAEGERLDRFLAARPEAGSRAAAERLVAAGDVLVDGVQRPKSHRLAVGEVVSVSVEEPPERAAPDAGAAAALGVGVAYEDEHLAVVDKPAGLLVHPVPGTQGPTLVDALAGRSAGGDPARPGIVHRLDRDTSGLLVVARSDEALRRLQALLRRRRMERVYTALVHGRPPSRRGTIDAAIGRDRREHRRISIDTDVPRHAVTHFTLAEALPGWSLLEVRLETGRTHQIRVHLAAIGHPVCADPVYGHAPELGLSRQFLHASRLRFPHPFTGEEVDRSSPLPGELEDALRRARGGVAAADGV